MRSIYLDYNATTPLMPEVLAAMLPYLTEHFGNPSSGHAFGQRAKEGVEAARAQVATLLGCQPAEVLFTSGGTESDNLALHGVLHANGLKRVITSAVEHPAIEQPCRALEEQGLGVVRLAVDGSGIVVLDSLEEELAKGPTLVTVMHAHNETGALQPIAQIAALAHRHGSLVHTDAAQSVGKIGTNVDELGVDLLTVAGHKLYAPKGVGALFVREGTKLSPLVRGAGHERGLRPGTENVASIVALGAACGLACRQPPKARLMDLTARLWEGLKAGLEGVALNGPEDAELRLPNTLNVSAPGLLGREWLAGAQELAASTGSACHDGLDEPSGALLAMGLSRERALGAVRLTLGRPTTEAEIEVVIAALCRAAKR